MRTKFQLLTRTNQPRIINSIASLLKTFIKLNVQIIFIFVYTIIYSHLYKLYRHRFRFNINLYKDAIYYLYNVHKYIHDINKIKLKAKRARKIIVCIKMEIRII